MKNIAIVIDSLAGGGAEKVMLVLAKKMVSLGHKVSIFSLKQVTEYEVSEGIELIFPLISYKGAIRGWFNTATLAEQLKKAVKTQEERHGNFDLSLLNLYESYRIGGAANLPNCYYVMHNSCEQELKREWRMGPIKYWYMKRILRSLTGKRLIGVSKGVSHELANTSLFSPERVAHIYNPFDVDDIRKQAKEPIDFDRNQAFILHVGRAAKAKRHDVLFRAFAGVSADYKLVCLSNNIKKLRKLAHKHGISDRVVLPGFQENPYAWMNRADLLVLSSDFEGLSLVLIEGLICGTKLVSTNCPHGPSEILTGDQKKYLVEVGNFEALARAINEALAYDRALSGLQLVNQVDVSQVVDKYLALA
ncbi:glycosyltransferase [Glaciecola petra]|uniref:Glycosyltransferase n=1 Tax=Glaciecola petra TaxID=3075602 RepID=A0ABU2ZUW2_9ALTE|nr:glycosyltransferase [Aestuariibacter sp. P117]MDT0596430.1 glycosyltransferase [Aestuariibacter sp. P117]